MMRFLRPYSDVAYTAMRVVIAFLYFCHGAQKVFGAVGGHQMPLTSQFGIAGILELVLGALIALGLATSPAAFIASGEMAFAFFTQHFPRGGLPIQNGGELAVGYCFVFLYIATRGGGRWSLDRLIGL
jgi:putative oxidoreductase